MARGKKLARKVILASSSPRRQKLLKLLGIKFKVVKSNLNEEQIIKNFTKIGYKKLVKVLALLKAIYTQTSQDVSLQGDEVILGFDTIIVCRNKIIGKPKNKKDALQKILFLSNKEHKVCTGIALIDLKKKITLVDLEETKVIMKKISKQEALSYIKTREPLDKAGAYAIQGKGKKFIKAISGDYFNVVGLPLNKFLLMIANTKKPIF